MELKKLFQKLMINSLLIIMEKLTKSCRLLTIFTSSSMTKYLDSSEELEAKALNNRNISTKIGFKIEYDVNN